MCSVFCVRAYSVSFLCCACVCVVSVCCGFCCFGGVFVLCCVVRMLSLLCLRSLFLVYVRVVLSVLRGVVMLSLFCVRCMLHECLLCVV